MKAFYKSVVVLSYDELGLGSMGGRNL